MKAVKLRVDRWFQKVVRGLLNKYCGNMSICIPSRVLESVVQVEPVQRRCSRRNVSAFGSRKRLQSYEKGLP